MNDARHSAQARARRARIAERDVLVWPMLIAGTPRETIAERLRISRPQVCYSERRMWRCRDAGRSRRTGQEVMSGMETK